MYEVMWCARSVPHAAGGYAASRMPDTVRTLHVRAPARHCCSAYPLRQRLLQRCLPTFLLITYTVAPLQAPSLLYMVSPAKCSDLGWHATV